MQSYYKRGKMTKLYEMISLQQKLNDATNGEGWERGITKNNRVINWRRCIYMESAEMIDSFSWKHWKSISETADYENLQIEIVDVWHFVMSLLLEFSKNNNLGDIAALSEKISAIPQYKKLQEFKNPSFADDDAIMAKIENVMRLSLLPVDADVLGALIDEFFELAHMGGLDEETLYRLYVGKNILNQFRQDNGYKDGTYIKIWDALEDNAVMKRGFEDDPDMSPQELYQFLEQFYPKNG